MGAGVAVRLSATYTRPVMGPAFARLANETWKRGPWAPAVTASTPRRIDERRLRMGGSCGTLESLSIRRSGMRRLALCFVTIACAAPAASTRSAPSPQLQGEIKYQPTDEQVAYGMMAASAMKQSRFLALDKTIGVYQSDDPRHPLHPIVKLVLDGNANFREIHKGEMQVACSVPDRPGLRGTRPQDRVCGLDRADVLFQLTTTQIMRDSGYVGGYITQVFKGEDRPKTAVFCFISVFRKGTGWEDVHNSLVKEPLDCSAGKKH